MKGSAMRVEDMRGKRVVFVSHCLLDQNVRFPGIAVRQGAIEPLVRGLCDAGVGIEQLPCLEVRYWGGIDRRLVMPFLRISPRVVSGPLRGPYFLLLRLFMKTYGLLCGIEARRTSRVLRTFINSGYEVLGIIVMNDSPTCGFDRTLDVGTFVTEAREQGVDWSCLTYEKMSCLLPGILCDGSGAFIGALKGVMEKKNIDIQILGFNPWSDGDGESERLLSELPGGQRAGRGK
jgi:hypothetical protein